VIDYDQSRNYRFLIVSENGDVFLLDEKGKELDGWNPKKTGKKILEAGHERIVGRDYFFLITEDGQFYLFNRKGDMVKGFPVQTQTKINGQLAVHGKDFQSSYFTLISEDGLLLRVNLSGETIKKEPLLKSSNQSRFGLVSSGNVGYIWRVDKAKFAMLDLEGKLLFEKENPASDHLIFNYFPSSRSVFTVFDKSQELLLILDDTGKELINQPLEATMPPSVQLLPGSKLRVNYVFRNRLSSLVI
jgi:hypothetical protein